MIWVNDVKQKRSQLFQTLAVQGKRAAEALVEKFDKLGLGGDDLQQERLQLCQAMIAKQEGYWSAGWIAEVLAENFDKLDFGGDERLVLCQMIVAQGHRSAEVLVDNFDKLGLKSDERLEFCQKVAERVPEAIAFVNNLDKLGLKKNERLVLCQTIAAQGKIAAEALVNNFNNLGLEGDDLKHERLALCQLIATPGTIAAEALVNNFKKCCCMMLTFFPSTKSYELALRIFD